MPPAKTKTHFNLDALDRESVDPGFEREKFTADIAGKVITFEDPAELEWAVVITMDSTPSRFFRAAIADVEERTHVLNARLKTWQLKAVMQAFRDHYGIDVEGNDVASRR